MKRKRGSQWIGCAGKIKNQFLSNSKHAKSSKINKCYKGSSLLLLVRLSNCCGKIKKIRVNHDEEHSLVNPQLAPTLCSINAFFLLHMLSTLTTMCCSVVLLYPLHFFYCSLEHVQYTVKIISKVQLLCQKSAGFGTCGACHPTHAQVWHAYFWESA